MKEKYRERLFVYGKVLFAAMWVIFLMMFVIMCQTEYFYNTLYVYSNLLSTQQIFLVTIKKLILAIALFSFGLSCIFLYIISYETEEFLRYTRIFWYAAGLLISIWDYETVFYAGKEYIWLWRVSGDICLVLFSFIVYSAIIDQLNMSGKYLKIISTVLGAVSLVIFCLGNLNQTRLYLNVYLCAVIILFVMIYGFYLKESIKQKKNTWMDMADHILMCFISVVPVLITFVTARYKYDTLSNGYWFYVNILPFVILVYAVVLFTRFFQYHRTGFLVGGVTNRKIKEITRHKEMVTKMILSRCMVPVNNLKFYSKILLDSKELAQNQEDYKIMGNIDYEVSRLKESIQNVENFHYLFGQGDDKEKIKINITAVVHYTLYLLKKEGIDCECDIIWNNITDQDFLWGDPSLLIQANKTLFTALFEIRAEEKETVLIKKSEDGKVSFVLSCQLRPDRVRRAKKIKRILNNASYSQSVMDEEDMSLYVAKNYIRNHNKNLNCRITKENQKLEVKIQYELNGWSQEKEKPEVIGNKEKNFEEKETKKKVILLSTVPEQIEIIQSYLMFDGYKILCCHTEEDAMECVENGKNIRAIIIGTIFFSAHIQNFCEKVREYYSLEQLPILIICQEKYKYFDDELLKYVNDIMTEPFERVDLLQKLKLLFMLQNSAQETTRAKLDFLQAQMDPHFIFNTLSTIMPLCIKNPMQAYEMLTDFSQYLRGRLYTNDLQESVPISRELELIQAYLSIEKVRFSEYLEYEMNVEVNEEISILPLLIEPIVENSVKHGIKGRQKLKIVVDILDMEDYISITVRDNGKGMTDEKLRQIMEEEPGTSGTSIGIRNVRKRLAIYYNQILTIQSIPDMGTQTFFKIPKNYL